MSLSAASTLAALRRNIASLEAARPAFRQTRHYRLDCEPAIFRAVGGSIRGALHEIAAAHESAVAAAAGFALTLAARAIPRAILWVGEDMAGAESGAPHGPGLDLLGLAPERFIAVSGARPRDVLWTMEEGLRCGAVGAAIGEIRGTRLDLTATRRLSLAAASNNSIALLLRTAPDAEPSAAATRWVIGAAPSGPHAHALGRPRIAARLVRNRFGQHGAWMLEWNDDERCFDLAPADREPVVQAARDRSRRAAARSA